jgi:hypothetical protein
MGLSKAKLAALMCPATSLGVERAAEPHGPAATKVNLDERLQTAYFRASPQAGGAVEV